MSSPTLPWEQSPTGRRKTPLLSWQGLSQWEAMDPLLAEASEVALVVNNLPANAGDVRDTGSIPGSRRSRGWGHGNPLQYSCLENPMDRGPWQAAVHGFTKSRTLQMWLKHTLFAIALSIAFSLWQWYSPFLAVWRFAGSVPLLQILNCNSLVISNKPISGAEISDSLFVWGQQIQAQKGWNAANTQFALFLHLPEKHKK